jgi:hypothetical protein
VSRNEGKIGNDGNAPVDATEILAALAGEGTVSGKSRQNAVSCYLSASEGWREASTVLGGAFAADDQVLKAGKDQ